MTQLKFANLARTDLQNIHDFIAKDNPTAAASVIEVLEERCRSLVQMPNIGQKRDDISPRMRGIVEGNYLILYTGTKNSIFIVRILHTKRNVDEIMRKT